MQRFFLRLSSLFTLLILACCNLEPPYNPPDVPTPSEWKTEQPTGIAPPPEVDFWWEVFEDPILSSLEQEAVHYNYSLELAAEKIVQEREFAKIVRSRLYPQINLLPVYNNQDILTKLFGQSSNQTTPGQNLLSSQLSGRSSQNPSNIIREHQLLYALPLSLSFEVDLWGKLRGNYRAALLDVGAQNQAYISAMLILTTDLASVYFRLRTLDNLIDLYTRIIGVRKKALDINQTRYDSRIIDYSAVAQAEFEYTRAIYFKEEFERERALLENLIAVAIGVPASEFSIAPELLTGSPPQIPSGIPSEILLQRPDLAELEFNMASLHQKIGVAYASYFPALELTAGLGFSSPTSDDFMKWKSRFWGFGTDISQYVYDAGARDANVAMTWSEFRQSVLAYQQRVVVAFGETEDALSNLEMNAKQVETVQRTVAAAHKAYVIALDRYRNGITNYLEVVFEETQELNSIMLLLITKGLRYVYTVELIKSLGGGWEGFRGEITCND